MQYKVVKDFTDLKDNRHVYIAGDIYPRDGVAVNDERVAELASTNNKRGEVLIKAVETAKIAAVSGESKPSDKAVGKPKKAPKKANKTEK